MWHSVSNKGFPAFPFQMLAVLVAVLLSAASCSRTQKAIAIKEPVSQKTFASPDAAGAALLAAATSADPNSLIAIFGPGSNAVLFTGDRAADKAKLQEFATAYNQMHRWAKITAGGQVLHVGADNYPFPIPLGQNTSGQWYFDTAAGKDEILARRIGKNELTAMEACAALAGAEQEYLREAHDGDSVKQYTPRFVSDPGKHNGLYWPVSKGEPPSPVARLGDFPTVLGYTDSDAQPRFNGYSFVILTKGHTAKGPKDYMVNGKMTGGFAIFAYPTDYRSSGIMSFLVGEDGTVYQKDLGENTPEVAAEMVEFNPADHWASATMPTTTASRTVQ
jgi:hypothetical protein